jgi:RNA polymerase sigma factor (TIGR02999 family)
VTNPDQPEMLFLSSVQSISKLDAPTAIGNCRSDSDEGFEWPVPQETHPLFAWRLAPRVVTRAPASKWIALVTRRYTMSLTMPFSNPLESGDHLAAADALFSTLYSELHRMAKRELARRGGPASLSVTTLLHEAYLDISAREGASFPDEARFMGYAARVMRGIIIDRLRSRNALKRGREFQITSLDSNIFENPADPRELSLISDALDQLAKVEPLLAEVVDLKFFCGFSFAEIATMQKLSERSVQRRWEKARIYLHCNIRLNLSQ